MGTNGLVVSIQGVVAGLLAAVAAMSLAVAQAHGQCEIPALETYNRGAYSGTPSYDLAGNKAMFFFGSYNASSYGLAVYDVSNRNNPVLQGLRNLGSSRGYFDLDSQTQVLWRVWTQEIPSSPDKNFITSYDLADQGRIILRGEFDVTDTLQDAGSIIVHNRKLHISAPGGIDIYEVPNPAVAPSSPAHFAYGADLTPFHTSPDGRYVYATDSNSIVTLDTGALPTISLVASMAEVGELSGAYFGDDLWLVQADYSGTFGFHVYDLSDPARPVLAGSWTAPESDQWSGLNGFLVQGTTAYVTYRYGHTEYDIDGEPYEVDFFSAKLVDISNRSNPVTISEAPVRFPGAYDGSTGIVSDSFGGGRLIWLDTSEDIIGGPIMRIAADLAKFAATDDTAYVVDPDRRVVMTFDLTQKNRVELIAEATLEEPTVSSSLSVHIIFIRGQYLYLVNERAQSEVLVFIYDMQDPHRPQFVGQFQSADDNDYWYNNSSAVRGPRFHGNLAVTKYYSFSAGTRTVDIYDWSDPLSPELITTYVSANGNILAAEFLDDDLVVWTSGGLERLGLTNPANPSLTAFFPEPTDGFLASLAVGTDRVYALVAGQLWSVDKSMSPGSTPVVASLSGEGITGSGPIAIWGDVLMIQNGSSSCVFFDIKDPSDPRRIDQRSIPRIDAIYPRQGVAWFGGAGIRAFDLQSGTTLAQTGAAPTQDTTFGVSAAYGDHAFVSDYYGGVRIFDVSDMANPFEVGAYDTPDRAYETVVVGNLAYVVDGATGLVVLDVSDPASPTLVGSLALSDLAIGLAVEGDFAYVATRFDGLQILDITNPASLVLVGSVDTPGSAQSVAVDGNMVYVADGSAGIQVIDVTARSSPNIVGSYNTPSSARQVLIRGLVAYVPDRTTGLIALDISDPTNPQLISTLSGLGDTRGVTAWGHLAFVADFNGFVHMVDITDPGDMQLLQSVASLGTPRAIRNDGQMLYLADGDAGLTLLDAQPCWYNPCPADLIEDGLLNFFDVQAFLNAYSAGDGLADWNNDGLIDFFDLQRYLIDYSAGCP
jgi:hypothetical protein